MTTVPEVKAGYRAATLSMARLNRIGAQLMHKYGATAATDVTGFGILGHAINLAQNQVHGQNSTQSCYKPCKLSKPGKISSVQNQATTLFLASSTLRTVQNLAKNLF